MTRLTRRGVVGASLLAPALLARPRVVRAQEAVNLTYWCWTPDIQKECALFEQANPGIKVTPVNVGQGVTQYTKMRTAIKAGAGLPDVAQVEYYMQPSFRLVKSLADIAPYGGDKIQNDYVDWAWAQVATGGKVTGVPGGSGPVALLYRQDIFDKYKITPPHTWDEFGESAIRLHQAAPDIYLGDIPFNDSTWMYGCFWQAGWNPFHVEGDTIQIAINDAAAKRVAAWWQKMVDAKALSTMPAYTPEWYASFDRGVFATWFIAAWGPVFLAQFAKTSAGLWRAAPPPIWDAGNYVSANMGGSTMAVTTQSKHPREAAALAIFIENSRQSTEMLVHEQFNFPTMKSILASQDFADISYPFYGGQKINQVFIESNNHVTRVIEWSPFQDVVNQQLIKEMSAAGGNGGSLVQALDRVQDEIVAFARQQGFTVKV